jgi:hypothetical protein
MRKLTYAFIDSIRAPNRVEPDLLNCEIEATLQRLR